MKSAVVYYTRFGHTAVVAHELGARLSADVFQIEEKRPHPLPELARAVAACHFEIKPMNLDLSGYDQLVLCAPIWMRQPACPMRTFLRDARLSGPKTAVLLSTISGDISAATETVAGYLAKQGATLGLAGRVLTGKVTDEELRRAADEFALQLLA